MNSETLRKILIFGVYVSLIVPVVVIPSFLFPFLTGKALFFESLVEIMLMFWLVLAYVDPYYRPRLTPVILALTAFVLLVGIADVFGLNSHRSFWSVYERMDGFLMLLHIYVYFLIVQSLRIDKKTWYKLFRWSIIISLFISLLSLSKLPDRLGGTFDNAEYFAFYLIVTIFLVLLFIFQKGERHWRSYIGLAGVEVFLLIILFLTGTRGALIAIIAGFFILIGFGMFSSAVPKYVRKTSVIFCFVVILATGLLFAFRHSPQVQHHKIFGHIATLANKEVFQEARVYLWQVAWQGIKTRPILGWGQDNFPYVFDRYYDPHLSIQEPWFDSAHNAFIDWTIEAGILGCIAYLTFFILLIVRIWKRENESLTSIEKIVVTGLVVAVVINNMFMFDFPTGLMFVMLVAAYATTYDTSIRPTRDRAHNIRIKQGSIVGALGVSVLLVWICVSQSVYAATVAGNALYITQPSGSYDEVLQAFQKALQRSPDKQSLWYDIADYYDLHAGTLDVASQEKLYAFTRDGLINQIYDDRLDTKGYVALAMVYQNHKSYPEALATLIRAEATSPERTSLYLQAGDLAMATQKYDIAEVQYKQGLEYELRFGRDIRYNYYEDQALKKYLIASIYNHHAEAGENAIENIFGTNIWPLPTDDIIEAYAAVKNFDRVIDLRKRELELDPQNPQNYFSLAAAYYAHGDINLSIQTLEECIQYFPESAHDANLLIKQVRARTIKL